MMEENDKHPHIPSKYATYIYGAEPWPKNCNVIRKCYGYVLPVNCSANSNADKIGHGDELSAGNDIASGVGSACGGEWQLRPDDPENERFLGNVLENNAEERRKYFDSVILL